MTQRKSRENAPSSTTMARRAKEADVGTEQKEHQITEALERKRGQLDQEIAEFKAEKEYEYKVFERRLKDRTKESSLQEAPQSQRKRGRSNEQNVTAEDGLMQKEGADCAQRESRHGKVVQKDPGAETADLFAKLRSTSSPEGSPGPPGRFAEALREREREFQGVFTPSYLPLVDDTPDNQGRRSKELLQPPIFRSEDLSAARHYSNAMLSSSAETVHPHMTSPPLPPARPLSSSVPPEQPSHHRSDSSRSDNSIASLRSSLRDPKQPRSPKRVLFSIDDTLVSPSTSPIAQRSKSVTPTKPAASVDAIGGLEEFEVVRNKNGNGLAVDKSESNGVDLSSPVAQANGWTASLLTFGRAAESNLSKTLPSTSGADDFEHLESDDLFTFDEEMGRPGKNKSQETDPEDEYGEDEEVDEKRSRDSLTASSPHAGSLPIEIKWPVRREGRG